jgi:hypothetical protein
MNNAMTLHYPPQSALLIAIHSNLVPIARQNGVISVPLERAQTGLETSRFEK